LFSQRRVYFLFILSVKTLFRVDDHLSIRPYTIFFNNIIHPFNCDRLLASFGIVFRIQWFTIVFKFEITIRLWNACPNWADVLSARGSFLYYFVFYPLFYTVFNVCINLCMNNNRVYWSLWHNSFKNCRFRSNEIKKSQDRIRIIIVDSRQLFTK